MGKKIYNAIREKGLLDQANVVIDSYLTIQALEYFNNGKLKPLAIDPYDDSKDPIDHVQIF